jgi:hypothetical protein
LVKKVNSKVLAKGDLGVISNTMFTKFMINLIYFIFSRPPTDLRGKHIGIMFEEFFGYLRKNIPVINKIKF